MAEDDWVDVAYGPDAPSSSASGDDWVDVAFGPDEPTLGGELLRGAVETPKTLAQTVGAVASLARHPVQTVEDAGVLGTARGVGRLGSGVAGAIAGGETLAALGLLAGPAAPIVSPALGLLGMAGGGAAGLLTFNKADEAIESKDVSRLVPTRQDALDLAYNTGQGSVLGVAGKGLGAVGERLMPLAPEQQAFQTLITPGRLLKGQKYAGESADTFRLADAAKAAAERGQFAAGSDAEGLRLANNAAIADIGERLHGPDGILQAADFVGDPVSLQLTESRDFIKNAKISERPKLIEQLKTHVKDLGEWDGTISGLSKEKTRVGMTAFEGNPDNLSKGLEGAFYADLKGAVEQSVSDALGPEYGDQVKALNARQGHNLELRGAIEAARAKQVADELTKGKPGIVETAYSGFKRSAPTSALLEYATKIPGIGRAVVALNAADKVLKASPATASLIGDLLGAGGDVTSVGLPALSHATVFAPASPRNTTVLATPRSNTKRPIEAPSLLLVPNTDTYNSPRTTGNPDGIMGQILDAVKSVESGGNPKAVSPKGARGAYQLTSATAKDYGVSDPFDEPEARRGAQAKLTADLEHFGGDFRLALASYNAGRGKIDRLLKQTEGDSYDDIESRLPAETRSYIPKIFAALTRAT